MKVLNRIKLFFLSVIAITYFNCSNNNTSLPSSTSNITVKLMDEPGDYDHVYIEVIDVMVKINDDSNDDSGWVSLEAINTGIYDLLELTGGINVLLVDDFQIPSGTLNQIRLILGENNSVVIDGETFPLNTPSAQQSGLKIQVNEILEANYDYTFLLDFDVDESIVIAGNSGNINLKPVIRATIEADTGVTTGSISPNNVLVEISATNGIDTISSYTDENGVFVLVGLQSGSYTINILPDASTGLNTQTINNVEVSVGQTTDLGLIILE